MKMSMISPDSIHTSAIRTGSTTVELPHGVARDSIVGRRLVELSEIEASARRLAETAAEAARRGVPCIGLALTAREIAEHAAKQKAGIELAVLELDVLEVMRRHGL